MSTAAQHRRGNVALSRDIDDRAKARRDPIIERLEASRDIAHRERDAALAKVAEITAELERARKCLASSRALASVQRDEWEKERADLNFRLMFACKRNARLEAERGNQ